MANERRMGNIQENDPLRNRWMQVIENNLINFGCITSGHYIKKVCDPHDTDTFDLGQCLAYLINQLPEGEPLLTLASVGIGNIKLATAARLWKGLNGCDGADCPPVTVSLLPLDIVNPFTVSCEDGACNYDPNTNTAAYMTLGKQLLDPRKNIEYAAAILEEGALMTANAGEPPSAFASVLWYKHSVATYAKIKKIGSYADIAIGILADVDQALGVWNLTTTWNPHSFDIEPYYNLWLVERGGQ